MTDFSLCRGCYHYYSAKGGCTSGNGCWMARAKPYGTGNGRRKYENVNSLRPLQRANNKRHADRISKQSQVDKERFLELYNNGMSDRAIGRDMGWDSHTIRRVRIDLELPAHKRGRKAALDVGTPKGGL